MIEEFLLHPPFTERDYFFVICWGVYSGLGYLGERNGSVFRGGSEGDPCEVWSLARYHVPLGFGFEAFL